MTEDQLERETLGWLGSAQFPRLHSDRLRLTEVKTALAEVVA